MSSSQTDSRCAVILAAGDGKRMKSAQPKVLCEVLFQPMIQWVEQACRNTGLDNIIIVAGDQPELLANAVSPQCRFVRQTERRGTGHAVMMAADAIASYQHVAVLNGDAPFMTPEVLSETFALHQQSGNAVTLISASVPDPTGYGRVMRDEQGNVTGITEHKDATDAQREIREINSGAYWFDGAFLTDALGKLTCNNVQGEYYLTDLVGIAVEQGKKVGAYCTHDSMVVLGANDRKGLQTLNKLARTQILERHLENGVDIPLEDGVLIGAQVTIAPDAQILPGTILLGNTSIDHHAVIGPNSYVQNGQIGAYSKIVSSYITDSTVGEQTTIGPFSQLRPDSHVGDRVKIGDFVELKNATIGDETSIAHLTYLGDSDVGAQVNFGCGVVTANYDGKQKYRTVVKDRAFVGCNTNLIPPVIVGEGAYTAAGTTVDHDVPDGALAIGRVRQQIKPNWADEKIAFKRK